MFKHTMIALCILTLSACGYSDHDEGIGEPVRLNNLKQIQGIYSDLPINNGAYWQSGPYARRLASYINSSGFLWSEQLLAATSMVSIAYVNEQELAVSALNAQGQVLAQRRYRQPEDFTFRNGMLQKRPYTSGSIGLVDVERTSAQALFLNQEGNLVVGGKNIKRGFILAVPVYNQSNTYTEYRRLR